MVLGGPVEHIPLAESELEENLATSSGVPTSRLGRAKFLQLALATATVAGCFTFAAFTLSKKNKAKNGMAISKMEKKIGKEWRVYDDNCITAPDLCPHGTKCMLKDDSWAACLYPGQCEPGKFVKIECEGPENQRILGGETTYCKKWKCCTLTKPKRPPFEEDVYSDKLPPDYKPYLAVGPVAPPDRLSPHPWQPACEKNGCPPTTTGCQTSTTPGCPPVETTADATSTAESVVWTTIQDSTAVTEDATTTKETVTTESSTATETSSATPTDASSATTYEASAATTEASSSTTPSASSATTTEASSAATSEASSATATEAAATTTEAAATTTEAAATTIEAAATTTEAAATTTLFLE